MNNHHPAAEGSSALVFLALAALIAILVAVYWTRVLAPQLERAAATNAQVLAQSHGRGLARLLDDTHDSHTSMDRITDFVHELMLLTDQSTGFPFVRGFTLEVDYDQVPVPRGSLEMTLGQPLCPECQVSEVVLFSSQNGAMLGVARFIANPSFVERMKQEVGIRLLGGTVTLLLLTALSWLVVLRLMRRLQRGEQRLIRARNEAEAAREEAMAANRAKSEFLANMSHEIRTPMNTIVGLGHLMSLGELSPQQRDQMDKIQNAAQVLLGIIDDILDFSKIEAGRLELEQVPFDLDEVLAKVSGVLGFRAEEKGLKLSLIVDPALPHGLVGDPLRLEQVLLNLGANAVKFTRQGEVVFQVERVAAPPGGVTVSFSVRDTGIGMTPPQLERLFQPFTQGDGSTTRHFGGTGLGLVISQHLVAMMGGVIQVESAHGQGSRFAFSVTFGLHGMAAAPCPRALPPDDWSMLRGLRVLVVEDHDINWQVAEGVMGKVGVLCERAENGQQALKKVLTTRYDVVLMDLQMPVMDGYEATRLLRRHWNARNLPIVAMTAHAVQQEKERCLALGMNDYLTKPINVKLLYAALRAWGGRGEVAPELPELPVPAGELPFPVMAGLDVAAGLERLAQDEALYHRLIGHFVHKYQGCVQELEQMLHARRVDEARQYVHGLKGSAGNISAPCVHALASELEERLWERAEEHWPGLLQRLDQAMDGVVLAAKQLRVPVAALSVRDGESF